MCQNEWHPIATMPVGELVLVYLPGEKSHNQFHTSIKRQIVNGTLHVVGHHFASDLGSKPTHWMRLPGAPEGL